MAKNDLTETELINILEPHYWNQGFREGKEAKEAVKKSRTFVLINNLITKARLDELVWSLGGAKEGGEGAFWINKRIEQLEQQLKEGKLEFPKQERKINQLPGQTDLEEELAKRNG